MIPSLRSARSLVMPLLVPAMWLGLAGLGCGDQILSHTEPSGDELEITCPFKELPAWCFMPVELKARCPGKQPADWYVSANTNNYYSGSNLRSGVGLRARAGDVTRGSALIPVGNTGGHDGSYGAYNGYCMITASLAGGGTGNGHVSTGEASRSGEDRVTLVSAEAIRTSGDLPQKNFDHRQAPGDWRAYCGFHRIHITEREWKEMSPAAHTAIRHWIRLGGHLQVLAESNMNPADLGLPKSDTGQETGAVSRGSINEPVPGDDYRRADSSRNDWTLRAISGDAVQEWANNDPASFATPSAKVAAGFMLVVVLGFAVLVGPVNVFLLASARRRHRLFVTTPLISLAAGGLLVISVILSDGIGGRGVRYVWMENVGAENTNYLVQHQHSRCGAMFSTGFEIPEDAYLAPMKRESGELSGNFSLQLEAGKVRASGPWFSSRRSQNFYLAAARPGRGRIEQSGTPERPLLTSAFDFPIGRVFWLAPDGNTWWQAGALAQGTATALQPCTEAEVRKAIDAATALAPPEYGRDLTKASRRPGHFIAMADGIPAIETHKGIRWQTRGFVTGPVVSAPSQTEK